MSSLGKEKIKAIEKWVKNGGWLLIGTGERGKDTLGGFDSSFMEVSCKSVSKVGEENEVSKEMQQLGSYSGFTGIDFSQMPVAKLQRNNTNASKSEAYPGWVYACGDGPSVYVPFLLAKNRCRKFPRICVTEFMTRWQDIP